MEQVPFWKIPKQPSKRAYWLATYLRQLILVEMAVGGDTGDGNQFTFLNNDGMVYLDDVDADYLPQ